MTPLLPRPVATPLSTVRDGAGVRVWLGLGLSLLLAASPLAQTRRTTRPPARPPLLVSRLSTKGDYAVYGHGNSLCSAWSAAQPGTPSRVLVLAWVQGFLTGTGAFDDEQRKTTTDGIQESMTTYCSGHPSETIEVAASTLFVSAFGGQSATTGSPSLFIIPTADNFNAFLSAAITNTQVPVTVVTKPERAALLLASAPVDPQPQSAGARLARCLVGACGATKDRRAISVQLEKGDKVLWSYTVNQAGGEKNRQSTAEAIVKRLKADYFHK